MKTLSDKDAAAAVRALAETLDQARGLLTADERYALCRAVLKTIV